VPPAEWIPVAAIPPLVAQAQFELAQSKLAKNRSFARCHNRAHAYLLRALVSCGHCHRACIGRTDGSSRYSYYTCAGKTRAVVSAGYEHCPARYAPVGLLDALVWQDLCEVLTHPAELTRALEQAHAGQWLPQELQARHENLRKGRADLGRQLKRLTEAYLWDIIPLAEYERRRRELEQRDQSLAEQQAQLCARSSTRRKSPG
jgi:site-specific DNA recombinase